MRRLLVGTRELVAQKSAVRPSAGSKLSVAEGREPVRRTAEHLEDRAGGHENLGNLYVESGQTLQGSLSAVSKPNFASRY